MFFIERDDMVQDLPSATSDPALSQAILPWRLRARPLRLQARCLQESHHLRIELAVPIQNHVTISAGFRKCLPQLLHDPFPSGMLRYVAVENLTAFVLDDKEAIQHLERHGRRREEIKCSDHFPVILQEGEPLLIGVTPANNAAQIPGHAPLCDGKAKLLQFRMDFGSSPGGILLGQTSDQIPDLLGNSRPPAARSGPPAPVEAKAGAMPADDGLWLDNEEDIGPSGPDAAQGGPKQPVVSMQGW